VRSLRSVVKRTSRKKTINNNDKNGEQVFLINSKTLATLQNIYEIEFGMIKIHCSMCDWGYIAACVVVVCMAAIMR